MADAAPTPPGSSGRFFLTHLWLPLGLALLLLLAVDALEIDRLLSDRYYDPASARFPLRYNAALEVVMHQWAKYVVVLIGCGAFAAWLLSFAVGRLRDGRRLLLFLALALALGPAAVSVIKTTSNKHCPYDLIEYGGNLPFHGLFESAAPEEPPGRCFPSGHASAGFCLLAFYFVGRALGRPRLAWAGLALGLGTGLLFGFVRMVQGAHFLSHNLWAALVCWLVIVALYVVIIGSPQRAPMPAAGTE